MMNGALQWRVMRKVVLSALLCALVSACGSVGVSGGGSSDSGTSGSSTSTTDPTPPVTPPTPPTPPDPPTPPTTPPTDPALSITTTSLPAGWVGHAYAATLAATGGTAPLSWTLTAGTLPAGLALAGNGSISGTPTVTANATSLTFKVTDSFTTAQTQSVTLPLNVSPANISISVAPARAGLTVTQPLTVTATTNDNAGASWSISPAGGTFSSATSQNGVGVTFTAPSVAGVYTLTATSVTNPTQSATMTVGVTDLPGIYTYHADVARDGLNSREFALTTANVNTTTFGKLFSCTVDGAIQPQPLWVANLTIGGAQHNVIIVTTGQDSLYAFDADASPCTQLWHVNLIDAAHGGTPGEATNQDFGILGTPVIDPTTKIIYAESRSLNTAGTITYHRLHALDLTTGNEKTGSPVLIQATYPYATGVRTFDPSQCNARAGLALVGGTVYVTFAALTEIWPWWGWMMGYTYNGKTLTQTAVFNPTPNGFGAGIWMAGGAPAADANGNLYVITGNGQFDANAPPLNDYGDSFLQLNSALSVNTYFTPSDQEADMLHDHDFGSGGATLVLSLNTSPVQHALVGGGKDGGLYVVNGDSMGGYGDANALQRLQLGGAGLYSTGAFWNNTLYIGPAAATLQAYSFDTGNYQLSTTAVSQTSTYFGWPGPGVAISVAGNGGAAVVWALDTSESCSNPEFCGPAVLHAYTAANLATELWNSTQVSGDVAGNALKFTVPTVANGKVYIGTRGSSTNNGLTVSSTTGELDVYGLKP